jgi:hypothetical protein
MELPLEMPGEYVKLYCDGTRYWVTADKTNSYGN